MKSLSRDGLSLDEPAPDSIIPSQEPIDPLVMEKYTHRLHTEVRARTWHSALLSLIPALHTDLCSLTPWLTLFIPQTVSAYCICDGSKAALVKGILVFKTDLMNK